MRVTPKISVSPDATRKRNMALARPLRSWMKRKDMIPLTSPSSPGKRVRRRVPSVARAKLLHVVVRRQHLLAGDVLMVDHDAHAALGVDLGGAHPRAHGGLPVGGAEGDRTDGRLHLEALEGGHQLLRLGAARLADGLEDREIGRI